MRLLSFALLISKFLFVFVNGQKRWASDRRIHGSKENAYLSTEKIIGVTIGAIGGISAICGGILFCVWAYRRQSAMERTAGPAWNKR
ncbi:Uncharacterised protein g9407 [Pycnogonum litorale]